MQINDLYHRMSHLFSLRLNGVIDAREFLVLETLAYAEAGIISYQMYLSGVISVYNQTATPGNAVECPKKAVDNQSQLKVL